MLVAKYQRKMKFQSQESKQDKKLNKGMKMKKKGKKEYINKDKKLLRYQIPMISISFIFIKINYFRSMSFQLNK